jgi:D-glycero-alpha-D-manno-heptose 1-phosphate guanylyltransferase
MADPNKMSLNNIPAVLLVGGMGTRLRSVVPNAPKPLAAVGDKSFLELLIRQLHDQGIRHLVMCTGYLADQIENHFGDGRAWDVSIQYSQELQPLGTAGAVKLAQSYLQEATDFLVMNGDSFMEVDLNLLLRFHHEHEALASLVVRRVENAARYGTVRIEAGNRVTGFAEKAGKEEPGTVNAGVYVFRRNILNSIANGPSSLEKDVFPQVLKDGIFALEQHGMFIDIGTPEDYARAQQISDRLYQAASLKQ